VASILAAHVSKAEDDRILSKPASSWEAHDYFMRAAAALNAFMSSFRVADLADVRRLAERAVSLDTNYARPYQILSSTYVVEWNSFDTRSMNHAALEKAYELASMAVQLDGNLPQARAQFGIALSWKRQHQAALGEFSKAVAINPNFNDWRYALALLHASAPARALEVGRAYVRLDPFAPASASVWLGAAHYMLKEYEQALPHLREAVARMPNARFAHIWLAATYAQLGQLKLAREETAQSLRLDPGYSIEGSAREIFGFRSPEDTEHLCDGLRKAGMPER
jgi:adenylate cyclase